MLKNLLWDKARGKLELKMSKLVLLALLLIGVLMLFLSFNLLPSNSFQIFSSVSWGETHNIGVNHIFHPDCHCFRYIDQTMRQSVLLTFDHISGQFLHFWEGQPKYQQARPLAAMSGSEPPFFSQQNLSQTWFSSGLQSSLNCILSLLARFPPATPRQLLLGPAKRWELTKMKGHSASLFNNALSATGSMAQLPITTCHAIQFSPPFRYSASHSTRQTGFSPISQVWALSKKSAWHCARPTL